MKLTLPRRGRPRTFGRLARPVTLTWPEDLTAALTDIDTDLSCAAVRVLQPLLADVTPHPPAELSKYGDSAVIVVKRIAALDRIPGVTPCALPDDRALISLDESMALADFEWSLRDALDDPSHLNPSERSVLASIAGIMKTAPRTRSITVHRRSIIVLQSNGHRRIGGT